MSAEPEYRAKPEDIGNIWVRSDKGEMIPVSSVATVQYSAGPDALDRFNNLPPLNCLAKEPWELAQDKPLPPLKSWQKKFYQPTLVTIGAVLLIKKNVLVARQV